MSASEIASLDACEARNMLDAFNRTEAVEPPAPTLHGLFARRAALSPHRPALRFPGGMLTYAELDQYTDRLAVSAPPERRPQRKHGRRTRRTLAGDGGFSACRVKSGRRLRAA